MNDIEAQVYSPIASALREEFPGISVSGEYVNAPSRFPHVSIEEKDNYISTQHLDTSDRERITTVMYEATVYSNKSVGKKTECRTIMDFIDRRMYGMNFTRISMNPVPNMENNSIYRLVARYEANTDGTNIFRR